MVSALPCLFSVFGWWRLACAGEKDVTYRPQIRPIVQKYCLECHAGKKPKGDLDLDRLTPDFGPKRRPFGRKSRTASTPAPCRRDAMPSPRPMNKDARDLA